MQKGGVKSAEQLWKAPGFNNIPRELRESPRFQGAALALGKALQGDDLNSVAAATEDFAKVLGQGLSRQPFSTQMQFALSDARSLANVLLPQISRMTKASQARTGETDPPVPMSYHGLHRLKAEFFLQSLNRGMGHLSDRVLGKGEIMVGGNRYLESKELGRGQFGSVSVYTAIGKLKPGNPRHLAVKTPMVKGDDPKFLDKAINGPLLEARALVNGTGTGGAELAGNLARFQSAIRGPQGEVLVVMRVEDGPSTSKVSEGALERLNSTDPARKITEQQYENLNITLFKDAVQGAIRLHQGAQLIHHDLKPDNWLIDSNGRVKLADPGSSRTELDKTVEPSDRSVQHPIPYAAPEALSGRMRSTAADVWSLGIVLFEKMSKKGTMALVDRAQHPVLHGSPTPPDWGEMQKKIIEFGNDPANSLLRPQDVQPGSLLARFGPLINAMTNPDTRRRPTLEQVLAHPLLNQPGFGGDDIRELVKSFGKPAPAPWTDPRHVAQPQTQPNVPQEVGQGIPPEVQQVAPDVPQPVSQQVVQPGDGPYGSLYGNNPALEPSMSANLRALDRLRPEIYNGDMPDPDAVDEDLRGDHPYGQPIPIGQTVPDLRDFGPLRDDHPYANSPPQTTSERDLRDLGQLPGAVGDGRDSATTSDNGERDSGPLREETGKVGYSETSPTSELRSDSTDGTRTVGYTGVRDTGSTGYASVKDPEKDS